ncbi:SUMO1 sentrin specific peptidase 8 [Homalodisca vitripennis]|nr:SUMO1 sentrin specific peptidase 8 [Homalodisca vitripennis]
MNESMVADKTAPNNLDKKDVFTTHDTQPQNKLPERTQISLEILGNEWLTDESIQFYYQVLTAKVIDNTKSLLMNPIISQAIKCLSDFELVLDKVELQGKTHIVIPVNDSPAVDKPGGSGSHWSLLLYVAEMEEFCTMTHWVLKTLITQ